MTKFDIVISSVVAFVVVVSVAAVVAIVAFILNLRVVKVFLIEEEGLLVAKGSIIADIY